MFRTRNPMTEVIDIRVLIVRNDSLKARSFTYAHTLLPNAEERRGEQLKFLRH
jgi:hypothetical protein